jgi:hypothetical protein
LTPGQYRLYATGGTGSAIAAIETVVVAPTAASTPDEVMLVPAWTDTVTAVAATGTFTTPVTVWFHQPGGISVNFTGEPVGTAVGYLLPEGLYSVQANATGSPYGVSTRAVGAGSVNLLTGNAQTTLTVTFNWRQTLSFQIVGPATATVTDGNWVSFAYLLRNTGNQPFGYRLIGTPSFWTFDFSPSNGSLGVLSGNNTVNGEVRILIPAGTPVAHPTINLEALTVPGGGVAGFANPTPGLNIVPYVGLTLGSGTVGANVVSPTSASMAFFVFNSGNVPEGIYLSVQDGARLSGLGWSYQLLQGKSPIGTDVIVQPGSNQSFVLKLSAPTGAALPPGSATVSARVLNLSGSLVRTLTLTVPSLRLGLNSTTVVITGPSIGSPPTYPDWLVPVLAFVPAMALVIGVGAWRWYRTRRWTRR